MGYWPLLILFVLFLAICALLTFFILLQRGKGEGLAGLLGGGAAADGMGTPEAQKELSRWTAYLAGLFFGMCLLITVFSSRCGGPAQGSIFSEQPAGPAATMATASEEEIARMLASPEFAASPELVHEVATSEIHLARELAAELRSPEATVASEPQPFTASPELTEFPSNRPLLPAPPPSPEAVDLMTGPMSPQPAEIPPVPEAVP
jgi:protein translocase SecG subunit